MLSSDSVDALLGLNVLVVLSGMSRTVYGRLGIEYMAGFNNGKYLIFDPDLGSVYFTLSEIVEIDAAGT